MRPCHSGSLELPSHSRQLELVIQENISPTSLHGAEIVRRVRAEGAGANEFMIHVYYTDAGGTQFYKWNP